MNDALEQSRCSSEKRSTKDYSKVCSTERTRLEEGANSEVGGEVTLCRSCLG